MKSVYFVRHAESLWNASTADDDESFRDADLSEKGEKQLEALAESIRGTEIGDKWRDAKCIVCSPLTRSVKTAIIIHKALKKRRRTVPIIVLPEITEIRVDHSDIGRPGKDILKTISSDCDGILKPLADSLACLPERWWLENAKCDCADQMSECKGCIEQRTERALRRLDEIKGNVIVVTHRGFIENITGQRLGNVEIAEVKFIVNDRVMNGKGS